MGTINTAEVAKKNPSVYIEMVQQKADLDLAALENSRQLSLLYLETYARENNLSESEKVHLENVIDYKVFTEEAAVKKSLWERIKAAFKRVFDWLFGKGSPKIREEDMDKKVKCAFDVNDADKKISTMDVLIKRLTGSQTKGEADKNAQELADAVNTLKNVGNTATWTFVTLAAVDGFKSKLHNVLKSAETASDSYKQAYEKELEKYKKEELSDEEKKERDELQEKDSKIMQAIVKCQTDLKDIESEVARLSKLSDEGKVDESNTKEGEDKGEDKKEVDPDAAEMQIASGNDGGRFGGSAPKSSDEFINWINEYHYQYTEDQYNTGVKPVSLDKKGSYHDAGEEMDNYVSRGKVKFNELEEVINKSGTGGRYKIGVLPKNADLKKTRPDILKKIKAELAPVVTENVRDKVIIPMLYGTGDDYFHANADGWKLLTNAKGNDAIKNFVKAVKIDHRMSGSGYINAEIRPSKDSKGKITYKKQCPDKTSADWAVKVTEALNTASSAIPSAWNGTTGGVNSGNAIRAAIKTALGLQPSDPDPVYYTL